jgi:hypothetical protein
MNFQQLFVYSPVKQINVLEDNIDTWKKGDILYPMICKIDSHRLEVAKRFQRSVTVTGVSVSQDFMNIYVKGWNNETK